MPSLQSGKQSLETQLSELEIEKLRREKLKRGLPVILLSSEFQKFQARYRNDRAAFVHDCIKFRDDEGPAFYQDECLDALTDHKRICVRGPHGLGKTALNAWIILHFALTNDGEDWKNPTTAGAWRQLVKYLWPEVRKWAAQLRWDKIGRVPFNPFELQLTSLKLKTGEAFPVASDNPAMIEGAHADKLLYIFDEGKSIGDQTYDAAEGAFSNAGNSTRFEALAAAFSTPGEPVGRFYDIQSHQPGFKDWWVRHVTLEECIKAGRISKDWVEARRDQWGEDSAIFKNRVLGEFASADENSVIPLSWVEAANRRWLELEDSGELDLLKEAGKLDAVGLDVGDQGDESVMALRMGQVITELRHLPKQDVMRTTGRLFGVVSKYGGTAVIDVIGIGAGVVARLRELADKNVTGKEERAATIARIPNYGHYASMREDLISEDETAAEVEPADFDVVAFHAAESSSRKDQSGELSFLNKRAEIWWLMRERLDPANGSTVALPLDDKLTGDLVSCHYRVTSRGEYQIEKKEEVKKRLGRSTDSSDAVLMSFYQANMGRARRL